MKFCSIVPLSFIDFLVRQKREELQTNDTWVKRRGKLKEKKRNRRRHLVRFHQLNFPVSFCQAYKSGKFFPGLVFLEDGKFLFKFTHMEPA